MIRRFIAILIFTLTPCTFAAPKSAVPLPRTPTASAFFLHDGDRVVFYGDSITEQRLYGELIETYVLTRYPKMRVAFLNSGWGGDRVTGGGGGPIDVRLKRDVINYKPTVVTIFLGMNDGLYRPYDEATFQTYAQGLTHIVDTLTAALPGVRLTLITPSLFDKDKFQANPALDYNATLLKYGGFVKAIGRHGNIPVVDVNAPMVQATATGRKTDPKFSLTFDGIHPNPAGHLIIASAVLKAWQAPATFANITLVPNVPKTLAVPLPWPVPPNSLTALPVSPLPGMLGRLHIHRLQKKRTASVATPTSYSFTIDGETVGSVIAKPAEQVVALAPNFALPQTQQSQKVLSLVERRSDMWHEFWMDSKVGVAHAADVPTAEELDTLRGEDRKLDDLRQQARDAAQPVPHTFALLTSPTKTQKPGK